MGACVRTWLVAVTTVALAVASFAVGRTTASTVTDGHVGEESPPGSTAISGEVDADGGAPAPQRPRNVILFVGDGMGVSTVTAARILEGQLRGQSGEENLLSFESFPRVALSKTYNVDAQVPDSAGTITALMTGVKTDRGVLGVGPAVERGDCRTVEGNELLSWMMLAERAGMATGIVTTTRLTHATPAGAFATAADRNFEDDSAIAQMVEARAADPSCLASSDIALQLLDFESHGDGLEVALGGGRRSFLPTDATGEDGSARRRIDGRDLTAEWSARGDGWVYASTPEELAGLEMGAVDHLLGLLAADHLPYDHDRAEELPSLSELTGLALDRLQRDDNGFALLVEAGRIDHAHHAANAYRALTDTIELSRAVALAVERVDLSETLIIVTADHSHVFTIAGYPSRGNDILGFVDTGTDVHGDAYTTLGYASGPSLGYAHDHDGDGDIDADDHRDRFSGDYVPGDLGRLTLSAVDPADPDFRQQTLVELDSETHGGEDVAAYAIGAGSDLIGGVMEQNRVGLAIVEALGLTS
jgi:alkaline phosphatase